MAGRRVSKGAGVQVHGGKLRIWFKLHNGERCFESLGTRDTKANRKAAEALREEICHEIKHGSFSYSKYFPDSKRVLKTGMHSENIKNPVFEIFCGIWLKMQCDLAVSTRQGYERIIKFHWIPEFRGRRLEEITGLEIMSVLAKKNVKPKTYNNLITPIKGVFKAAYQHKLIGSDPSEKIKFARNQAPEPDPLTLEEVEFVLQFIKDKYPLSVYNCFEFAFFTGLRTSELIELKWTDIDLVHKIAHISRAKVRQVVNCHTKTYKPRDVELNTRALDALKRQFHITGSSGYIWLNPNTDKAYIDDRPLRRWIWVPTLKALSLRHRHCYQTRHTYATLLLMSGVNPAWAAKQLGHSVKIFHERYARWIDKADKGRELSKVEETLFSFQSNQRSTGIDSTEIKCANNVPKRHQLLVSSWYKRKKLVEAAGIEPASASTPPQDLHAYPELLI
jgi:integrase